jgi:hypothetical protein
MKASREIRSFDLTPEAICTLLVAVPCPLTKLLMAWAGSIPILSQLGSSGISFES